MIYTVTFNPSIDYYVTVDDFRPGMTNRTGSEQIFAGGKGINVSIVLNSLGIKSTALGFCAGFTGEKIREEIKRYGFYQDFIELPEGFSRINVKIKNMDGTEINGAGPQIPQEALNELFKKLDRLQNGDTLVMAGSVPKSLPESIYADICLRLEGRGVRTVIDATGGLLVNTLKYRPFLIKPNIHELGGIFNVSITNGQEAVPYAKKLCEMGAQNVIVSMGSRGALMVDENDGVTILPAVDIRLVSAVGAGDCMVAGFLAGVEMFNDREKAFKLALAAAAAGAASDFFGTGEEIMALYKRM